MPNIHAAESLGDSLHDELYELIEETNTTTELDEMKAILLGQNSNFLDAAIGENGIGTLVMKCVYVIAGGIMAVNLLIEVIHESERGEFNGDSVIRIVTKMTVAMVCILYADEFVRAIQEIGKILVETISAQAGKAELLYKNSASIEWINNMKAAADETAGMGTWSATPAIIETTGFASPILKLMTLAIKTVSYALFIEIAIRKAFVPIAMVGIVNDGPRSPGIRYLQKYFCVYLKMAIVIVALSVANIIVYTTQMTYGSGFSSIMTSLYDAWKVKAAALIFIKNGSSMAEEIMGIR